MGVFFSFLAVKFTETGHILLTAWEEKTEEDEKHMIHITVEDTGIGIPQSAMNRYITQVICSHN